MTSAISSSVSSSYSVDSHSRRASNSAASSSLRWEICSRRACRTVTHPSVRQSKIQRGRLRTEPECPKGLLAADNAPLGDVLKAGFELSLHLRAEGLVVVLGLNVP